MHCLSLRAVASPSVRRANKSWKRRRCSVVSWGGGHVNASSSWCFALKEVRRERRERQVVVNAAEKNNHDASFSKDDYIEAVIEHVTQKKDCGVVDFRLKDGKGSILPMYIGDFESSGLLIGTAEKETVRPLTHDLMRNALRLLGYEVTHVHVTALVGYTYHARIFFRSAHGKGEEVSIDSRPSDAVNLAVRFNAPIYVHRDVASRMATTPQRAKARSEVDVAQTCKEEITLHTDPTVVLKLQLQVAIAEEKYSKAAKLRDEIDKLLANDRVLGLVVALESALKDNRFEDALQIRDVLRKLRTEQEGSEKQESH